MSVSTSSRWSARRLVPIAIAGVVAAFAFPPVAQAPAAVTARVRGAVTVLHLAVPGDTGGSASRAVWVYRPAAVKDSSRLPVLYFLHGLPGSGADVFHAGLAASLDRYFAEGHAPFVVVSPDGNGSSHDDAEWANATDGTDQIETFVTDVVVNRVEGSHPRDAAHRAIAGFSMGGYGAMNLAMRHRNTFGSVVSISGYFHVDDPSGMFGGDPATIAANSPDVDLVRAKGLHILLLDSDNDRQPVTHGQSQLFERQLHGAGIAVQLQMTPGTHSWSYVAGRLPTLESFLERSFALGTGRA